MGGWGCRGSPLSRAQRPSSVPCRLLLIALSPICFPAHLSSLLIAADRSLVTWSLIYRDHRALLLVSSPATSVGEQPESDGRIVDEGQRKTTGCLALEPPHHRHHHPSNITVQHHRPTSPSNITESQILPYNVTNITTEHH